MSVPRAGRAPRVPRVSLGCGLCLFRRIRYGVGGRRLGLVQGQVSVGRGGFCQRSGGESGWGFSGLCAGSLPAPSSSCTKLAHVSATEEPSPWETSILCMCSLELCLLQIKFWFWFLQPWRGCPWGRLSLLDFIMGAGGPPKRDLGYRVVVAARPGCTSGPPGCRTMQMGPSHSFPLELGSPHFVTSTWVSEVRRPGLRTTVLSTLSAARTVENVGSGVGSPGLALWRLPASPRAGLYLPVPCLKETVAIPIS